jgi:DNA-binding NarL/FixJ family response regulator
MARGQAAQPRVVVADDHLVLRRTIAAMLRREGVELVGEASNGREAVRLCALVEPDVAVLDLSMPFMNGLEAARGIFVVSPRTRIVLLTAHLESAVVRAGLRAGVRGYVAKRNTPKELLPAILAVHGGHTYLGRRV